MYQFRTEEDPEVTGAADFCASAPFAANVLLTTVSRPSALKSWGRGPKRARVAVARRLAILLGRIRKDKSHFDAVPA